MFDLASKSTPVVPSRGLVVPCSDASPVIEHPLVIDRLMTPRNFRAQATIAFPSRRLFVLFVVTFKTSPRFPFWLLGQESAYIQTRTTDKPTAIGNRSRPKTTWHSFEMPECHRGY